MARYDQVRVFRDEGSGTGRFNYDFGQDQLTIDEAETNLSPAAVGAWIDPSIGKVLQPFRFTDPPTIHVAGTVQLKHAATEVLRLRVDAQKPFAYQFDGWEIPVQQGSADLSLVGDEPTNFAVSGAVSVQGAKISGSKFLGPLLTRLEPFGLREPLDSKLNFKLDLLSLRMTSWQMVSGTQSAGLTGSVFLLGGLADFRGAVDSGPISIRGGGTIEDPIWEVVSPSRK